MPINPDKKPMRIVRFARSGDVGDVSSRPFSELRKAPESVMDSLLALNRQLLAHEPGTLSDGRPDAGDAA